jgi:hypothetical protein
MSMLTDGDISSLQRKRDVSEEFTLARAEFNPATTMVRKGPRPKSTLYEHPYKQRFSPSDNAVLDGVDVSNADFTNNESNKAMLQGRLQKSRIAIAVSDLAQEFGEEYAAVDLMADNMADGLVLARESLETQMLKNGDSNAQQAGGPTDPARMRGAANWIRSANPGGSPDLPINSIALAPATNILSGISDVTTVGDTQFNAIMKSIASACFMKGVWDVLVTPDLMAVIDSYTNMGQVTGSTVPLRRFNKEMADTTITMEVRFYQTSFGKLRFHLHYYLPAGVHALIMQMDQWALRPGYPVRTRELPYQGGGHRRIIEYVNGLDCSNPRAQGKITT